MRFRILAPALALGLALAVPAVAEDVRGTFERTLKVGPAIALDVQTGSGDIHVRAGAPGVVHVVGNVRVAKVWWRARGGAERRLGEILAQPPVEQEAGRVRIGHAHEEGFFNSVSIDYLIEAPPDVRLRAASGSGDLRIHGPQGHLEASTGSGDVSVWSAPGGASVHTGSGDVALHEVHGELVAETGSGDVEAQGAPQGSWRVRTGSGNVVLALPPGAGFELDARTGSGDIECAQPVTVYGRTHRSALHGTVGSGGPLVQVHTGSGDITLR
ncbi:MAG TPA: DUF4097 family beta strand repeat-containing protein [Candidatus Saccharimonadales bacterium]|nr:DUF4097 family beta strand repeat-containing protein [Candidatus Saccharimonadales bacterium]